MNPAKWHACAAFVSSGLEHAAAPPAKGKAHNAERTLTELLRAFSVDCVEFFRSLRKFMSCSAPLLTSRLYDKKKSSAKGKRSPKKPTTDTTDTTDEDHAGLETLEASLSVPELRTSFAFTRVAAQKYKLFADVHLDSSTEAGADVARTGWLMFLAAKHSTLPKFPDLFSCYHTLVAVEAFLLVNAPSQVLRTDVVNMVSVAAGLIMDEKTKEKSIDVLRGLSASSKTKLPTLRQSLSDFETQVISGCLGCKPVKDLPKGLAKDGPKSFPDVFGNGDAKDARQAAQQARRAYTDASVKSGLVWHLRLDEQLYFALGSDEEAEAKAVLGDVQATAVMNGQGGVAATPRPGGQQGVPYTPWRGAGTMKFVLGASPARLCSNSTNSPYPASRLGAASSGGLKLGQAAAANNAHASVPFTPVSEAMASASWLHSIVSATGPTGVNLPSPSDRLERFLGKEVAAKLVNTVHGLAGKTSAALTEDAFLVTINGVAALAGKSHNVSLDNLVKRRQEEAVRVFAYFAEGVFEGEHRRNQGMVGDVNDVDMKDRSVPGAGGVMDVASLAATVPGKDTQNTSNKIVPDPDEAQRAAYRALAGSARFVRAVLSCAMEVVIASYNTATLKFPAVPRLLGLDAFDVVGMIEPFVRADPTMPREVKKHFSAIEERVMESMAWQRGSSFFVFMRAAEQGTPPPRPAAALLAAVSNPEAKEAVVEGSVLSKRLPSFSSVAGVAIAAAEGSTGVDPDDETSDPHAAKASFDDEDTTPPRKPKSENENATTNAFSTPLRGTTTPKRPARNSSGAAASLSAAGAGPDPLPSKFNRVAAPGSTGDKTARNSLRVFFAKVMRTSARRLADLCERLHLPQDLTKSAYELVSKVVYDHTSLLYNRHLDQILLCAVYGVCKVNSARGMALEGRLVTFRDIIACYHKQPQCREETFWTVSLEQSDPDLEVTRRGDVIQFYNQVFVPEVKTRLLALKTEITTQQLGQALLTGAPGPTGLRSPRRALPGNSSTPRSVYVSPMRGTTAAAAQMAHMTPRSKSLFAFVGESTHAYQSPGRDLGFINQRIAAAAAETNKSEDTTITAVEAGVAGIAAAIVPPVTKSPRRKSRRSLGSEFEFTQEGGARGGGDDAGRPPKAQKR